MCSNPADHNSTENYKLPSAEEILGNTKYPAIAYGSFRSISRDTVPSIADLKEDLLIMQAMGIKVIRTYHSKIHLDTERLLEAIDQLRSAEKDFEMYVMLGVWIECKDPWSEKPDHEMPHHEQNELEISSALELTKKYSDIIRIIAVGNEAMVHWAPYHVNPSIILEGVKRFQSAKDSSLIPSDIWITSSDNFASWGGEDAYKRNSLTELINAVDYISLHTYPFHETHYNPDFWPIHSNDSLFDEELIEIAMDSAFNRAVSQYHLVQDYLQELQIQKAIHIGETGWASYDNDFYGNKGSRAADELKQAYYYKKITSWANENQISCFYFEVFDEPWKSKHPDGSENHFGLININGELKYSLWDIYDQGAFEGLMRGGKELVKTHGGSKESLLSSIQDEY